MGRPRLATEGHRLRALVAALGLALGTATHAVSADDLAYGAYLAAECATCHRLDAAASGAIPRIAGLEPEVFARALADYRTGARDHAIMQNVAGSLDDAQIRALACYYASLRIDQP